MNDLVTIGKHIAIKFSKFNHTIKIITEYEITTLKLKELKAFFAECQKRGLLD